MMREVALVERVLGQSFEAIRRMAYRDFRLHLLMAVEHERTRASALEGMFSA